MSPPEIQTRLFILAQTDFAASVGDFLIDCRARSLSPRTVALYDSKLASLLKFAEAQGVTSVQGLTPDLLRRYFLRLADAGHDPGGVHVHFRTTRTFLRWAWQEYELTGPQPIARLRAPKLADAPLQPVSLGVVREMLAHCPRHTFIGDRDRAMILFLLDTGTRASEFVGLEVGDVNLTTGAVIIRHGKGGKFRTTFLGTKTRREIGRYLRYRPDAGPLWLSRNGTRLTQAGLRQALRTRAKASGVAPPGPHAFRRAFALGCLRGGMDVYSLQRLMGHADLTVLRRYLAQNDADLEQAHAKASPVDRLL